MRAENYQVCITYRCNWRCRWCYEHFDVLPTLGPESDITPEDIVAAGAALKAAGVQVGKVGVTGGEPLLHPDVFAIYQLIIKEWNPARIPHTFSNGSQPILRNYYARPPRGISLRTKGKVIKDEYHHPVMVAPADLGIKTKSGYSADVGPCEQQLNCGRCFDAFGFSACPYAAPLGRLFGIDVHSAKPAQWADEMLCRHCMHSCGKRIMFGLAADSRAGRILHPTPTFAAALKKRKEDGFLPIKKFLDRLKEMG